MVSLLSEYPTTVSVFLKMLTIIPKIIEASDDWIKIQYSQTLSSFGISLELMTL